MEHKTITILMIVHQVNKDLVKVGGRKAVERFHKALREDERFGEPNTLVELIKGWRAHGRESRLFNTKSVLLNAFDWSISEENLKIKQNSYWHEMSKALSDQTKYPIFRPVIPMY